MAETEIKSINGKPIADTTARQDKADKAGWVANKYIGTDENGNLIEKDPPQTGTGGITQETDPTVPAWAKQPNPPKYTASDVGALPADTKIPEKTSDLANDSGYITIAVATLLNYYLKTEVYNKSEAYSRSEVDNLISGLDKRLNAVADSEDVDLDQLSEIVAYIKSNKSLIDSITTSKVSIADIIDNLTTADAKKPLSAAQGKALKEMYDALPAWAKAAEKPAYTKAEVGLGNVDNVRQYSASNPPPYPVTSVNGETGAVNLDAAKVGALPASTKIPAKTSDITNDSGFITKTVADLVNYYTKSQTYTQAEVNALVSAIPKFAISVVASLPTANISTTTVYLVKSGTGGDLYTEYIYVGGAWEILGSQRVDLTGYATESWVNAKIADFLTADKLTAAIITAALGYTPAKQTDVDDLSEAIAQLEQSGGGSGTPGADGFSPVATVVQTDSGATITITDKNSTTTATVTNGKDGADGADGKDGINGTNGVDGKDGQDGTSVTVASVSESSADGGSNVVTFSDGKTLSVKNGSKGSQGEKGEQGEQGIQGVQGEKGETGAAGVDGKDYSFDPTVYGLPVLYLTGDISPIAVSKDNKVDITWVYGENSGSGTLKGQGATSYKTAQALVNEGKAGKFNYTLKLDTAIEVAEGWGAQKKYCLKANFIDHTHSRNICSCKLWGMSVKARSTVPTELADLPNGGAIDGFPVIIMLNDEFHGLYTWNIPKDGWMFGLVEDTTKTQAVFGAEDHTTATQFKGEMTGGEFELEFVSNEDSADWATTSLNRLLAAVAASDGSDLDTTIAQYLDWDSAIDHYIHTVVDKATDCVDKNFLLVTFDGTKWYMSVYDRDSIHGLNWDASGTTRPVSNVNFEEMASTSKLYELIRRFKTNVLKARYKELRGNILSESRIMQVFENFAWAIPSPVLQEDVKLYPTILGSSVNTIDQIGRFVRQRLEQCDKWVDALPAQETPDSSETTTTYPITNNLTGCVSSNSASTIAEGTAYGATITANDGYTLDGATVSITMGGTDITSTAYSNGTISIDSVTGGLVINITAVVEEVVSGYTNLVPTSTDTDGSIYNGVGYKDDTRLSSSGGVSGSAYADSVTTGFIPYAFDGIIRVKGATYANTNASGGDFHSYLIFYDSSMAKICAPSAIGYSAGNSPGLSVVYDESTGITTFDVSGVTGSWCTGIESAAYIRFNGMGSGADLIVTVNEEIV